MNLIDQAFLRWQRIHQPRRFRESLVAAGEQLVCALSAADRGAAAAREADRNGDEETFARTTRAPTLNRSASSKAI